MRLRWRRTWQQVRLSIERNFIWYPLTPYTLHLTPYTRHCEHPEFVDTKILVLSARIFLRCCQNRLITCYNSIEFVEILKKIYSYSRIFFSLFLHEPVKNVSNKINLASKEKILCLKRWCRSIKLSIFHTFLYIIFLASKWMYGWLIKNKRQNFCKTFYINKRRNLFLVHLHSPCLPDSGPDEGFSLLLYC